MQVCDKQALVGWAGWKYSSRYGGMEAEDGQAWHAWEEDRESRAG